MHTERWGAAPLPGLKAEGLFFLPEPETAFLKDMPEPCCQGAAGAGPSPDEAKEKGPPCKQYTSTAAANMASA